MVCQRNAASAQAYLPMLRCGLSVLIGSRFKPHIPVSDSAAILPRGYVWFERPCCIGGVDAGIVWGANPHNAKPACRTHMHPDLCLLEGHL